MNPLVSFRVATEFCGPIPAMGGRDTAMGATVHMPKAAADVDDFAQSRKHEIRRPWQRADMEAVTVAQRVNKSANNQFRRSVLRLDGCHNARALSLGKGVGHDKLLD